jgi:general secretion pathway protein G
VLRAIQAGLVRARTASRPVENGCGEDGVTLVELIIVVTILAILATAAVPAVKFQVKRSKERELRYDLWEMRRAIDSYKDVADRRVRGRRWTGRSTTPGRASDLWLGLR